MAFISVKGKARYGFFACFACFVFFRSPALVWRSDMKFPMLLLFCMLLLADFFLLSGPDLVVVGWYDRGRIPRAFLYREDGGTESGDRW